MHKGENSLPSLHVITNPNMSSTKRIHARMVLESQMLTLPKTNTQTTNQFRRVPLKVNPKVVIAFSPYQSYSIISFSDFLYEKHKKEKQLQRIQEKKQQAKKKDEQEKEQIKYFKQQDDNNDDIIDSIMDKVRMQLGEQPQSHFITN